MRTALALCRECPLDFFDLIIVDECYRSTDRDESSWREILEYVKPAYQPPANYGFQPESISCRKSAAFSRSERATKSRLSRSDVYSAGGFPS